MNLSAQLSPILIQGAVAAGQTTITPGSGIFVGGPGLNVLLIAIFGTVVSGSVSALKVQAAAANSGYADIGGSATPAPSGAGGLVMIDLIRPVLPWVLPVVTRTVQNATLSALLGFVYELGQQPPTLDASVIATNFLAAGSPLGTA